MSRYLKTEGIVLKESSLGENGKLLTLFTKDYGKITVAAKGVKKPGSSLVHVAQLFAYSKLEIYKGSSSLFTLTGGELIETFSGLSASYERIFNAGVISRIILRVIQEDLPEEDSLRLLLNSLYFLSNGKREPEFVKSVFILKLLQYEGIAPEIDEIETMWHAKLLDGTKMALAHIFESEIETLFSFSVSEDVLSEINSISNMLINDL